MPQDYDNVVRALLQEKEAIYKESQHRFNENEDLKKRLCIVR